MKAATAADSTQASGKAAQYMTLDSGFVLIKRLSSLAEFLLLRGGAGPPPRKIPTAAVREGLAPPATYIVLLLL